MRKLYHSAVGFPRYELKPEHFVRGPGLYEVRARNRWHAAEKVSGRQHRVARYKRLDVFASKRFMRWMGEDVSEVISMITPHETPLLDLIAANRPDAEWQDRFRRQAIEDFLDEAFEVEFP